MINLSICLTDIPKARIIEGKTGKKYLNITVDEMRQPDEWENTHTVYLSQAKEERDAKTVKTYLGKGKEYKFEKTEAKPEAEKEKPDGINVSDDLPF